MSTSDPVGLLRVLVEHQVEFVVIGHAEEALDRPKDRAQLPALYAPRAALRPGPE